MMNLHLLMSEAGSHLPVLPDGVPLATVIREPKPRLLLEPEHLSAFGGDPNDLARQRWGVIAPTGDRGDRLLEQVKPLCERRGTQQGAAPRFYRVDPDMDPGASETWCKKVLHHASVPLRDQPRYLLILGDAHEVSLDLQRRLAADSFVGRLAFAAEDDYRAYAEKVLAWEDKPTSEAQARTLFFTAHDGSQATRIGYTALVKPSVKACLEDQQLGYFPAREIREVGCPAAWSLTDFMKAAAEPIPSALLTLSHGLGPPREGWKNADTQRRFQGVMSLGEDVLEPEHVRNRPFFPGGFWLYFACFGVATPRESAFYPWLHRLQQVGEYGALDRLQISRPLEGRSFFAALPQAALANPEGPLAVVGHVDLAWTYSFLELTGMNHASRFFGALSEMVQGRRAGVAFSSLSTHMMQVALEIMVKYQDDEFVLARGAQPSPEALNRAHLWMTHHDLAGFMLMGDPAVTLPLSRSKPATLPTPRDLIGMPIAEAVSQLPLPGVVVPTPEEMERAILDKLGGDELPKRLAARHGVSLSELQRWEDAYRAAGRDALRTLKRGR